MALISVKCRFISTFISIFIGIYPLLKKWQLFFHANSEQLLQSIRTNHKSIITIFSTVLSLSIFEAMFLFGNC